MCNDHKRIRTVGCYVETKRNRATLKSAVQDPDETRRSLHRRMLEEAISMPWCVIGLPSLRSLSLRPRVRIKRWRPIIVTDHVRHHIFSDLLRKCRNGDGFAIGSRPAGHYLSRVRLMTLDLESPVSISEKDLKLIY